MKAIQKYFDNVFNSHDSRKDNLISCMKWLTKYVIGKEDPGKVSYEILLDEESETGIKLQLFAVLDDTKHFSMRCKACKEFHNSFFITDKNDCDRCNAKAYRKDIKATLTTIKSAKQEKLRRKVKG